jgi:hypothetical protein
MMKRTVAPALMILAVLACNQSGQRPIFARQTIVDQTFPVGAHQYNYYKFSLTVPGRVTGHFSASGGANDIDVWVVDEDGFANFTNNHQVRTFYQSGYVTAGTIDLRLNSGTYYVIFSNSKALLTNKVVTANVQVE